MANVAASRRLFADAGAIRVWNNGRLRVCAVHCYTYVNPTYNTPAPFQSVTLTIESTLERFERTVVNLRMIKFQ